MLNKRILVANESPKSIITEAFRAFRTNLLYSKVEGTVKSILFTSAETGEGKSSMVANTAVVLAQSGKKVIILDCDLRKPVQHQIFGISKLNYGLTDFLLGKCSIADIVQDTGISNLRVVTSGQISSSPSELLDSGYFSDVISSLQSQTDYVIVDSPPVLPVTDACILGSKVDGIILVVGVGKVQPEMAQRAKEHLEAANGNILGLMINRSDTHLEQSAYYNYYENADKVAT